MGPVTDRSGLPGVASAALRQTIRMVVTAAFWLAIALPAVYGPLLLGASVSAVDPQPAFYLLAIHALTIVLGQQHRTD